ncbi:MAG: GNAT family N-acetyltransferase, partial [bacterium]
MNPTIEIFHTLEDARATWTTFQDRGSGYVFQTYEWVESWYRHVGRRRGVTPVLVAVYDDRGEPTAFFAFGIESRGPARVLTWLGEPLNDYGAPIIVRDTPGFPEVWSEIQKTLPPVDIVRLRRIPGRVNSAANPMCELRCRGYHSSAHFVRLDGTWDAFYERHAGAKTRSTDRRKQRRLAEVGNITYEINRGNDRQGFDALARTMIEQKARRYREMNARNILADRGCREFFAVPAEELVASGRLHLSGLFVDREPV